MRGDRKDAASIVVVPVPATAKAEADRFTGDVWVDAITNGAGPGYARLATVRFSPGARTAWHRHTRGQTLHVTSGVGLVQSKDGQTIVMWSGDTVYTPPGAWHWHGALPDSFMTHLALADSGAEPGSADVEWGQHVSNNEYQDATANGESGRSAR
jgi:quercetin dioxygenase-like cupin family protein